MIGFCATADRMRKAELLNTGDKPSPVPRRAKPVATETSGIEKAGMAHPSTHASASLRITPVSNEIASVTSRMIG